MAIYLLSMNITYGLKSTINVLKFYQNNLGKLFIDFDFGIFKEFVLKVFEDEFYEQIENFEEDDEGDDEGEEDHFTKLIYAAFGLRDRKKIKLSMRLDENIMNRVSKHYKDREFFLKEYKEFIIKKQIDLITIYNASDYLDK
jgi:hypothetical protein